jgi:hypothetical protein
MIGLFVLYIILVTVVYNSNEHFITIRYFDNNNENFQMATEIISQDANCIKSFNLSTLSTVSIIKCDANGRGCRNSPFLLMFFYNA